MFYQVVVRNITDEIAALILGSGHCISASDGGNYIMRGSGAKVLENLKDKVDFDIVAIKLTESRICEYDDFVCVISNLIAGKINPDALENATAVLGVGDLGKILANNVSSMINEVRKSEPNTNGKMKCRPIHGSAGIINLLRPKISISKDTPIGKNDRIIFVHCAYEAPLELNLKDFLSHFSYFFSKKITKKDTITKKEKHLEKVTGKISAAMLQHIVIPVPIQYYEIFLEETALTK